MVDLQNISLSVYQIEKSLSIIKNSIDSDILARGNINNQLEKLCYKILGLGEDISGTSRFIHGTVIAYEDAERKLIESMSAISNVPTIKGKQNMDKAEMKNSPTQKDSLLFQQLLKWLQSSLSHIKNYLCNMNVMINNSIKVIETSLQLPGHITPLQENLKRDPDIYKEEVKMLQQRLNELGHNIKVDGYFGDETLKAVNGFKEQYGLGNTDNYEGVVGNQTWLWLFGQLNGELSLNPSKYDMYTKMAQIRLRELGYDIQVTGFFDDKTLEAVNQFKTTNKLGNTGNWEGVIGSQTWEYLFAPNAKPLINPEKPSTSKPISNNIDLDILTEYVNNYVDFVFVDANGNKSDPLQIYYEWGGKMSLDALNQKMLDLGLSADDPQLSDKIIELAKSEDIMLGIDCSGLVLRIIDAATKGQAVPYYKEALDLNDNYDVLNWGILASTLTSLDYATKITDFDNVQPGDYIRFDNGGHIGIVYKVEGDTIYYTHSSGKKGPHTGTITVTEEGKGQLDLCNRNNAKFDDWDDSYSQTIQGLFNYICRPNFIVNNEQAEPEIPNVNDIDIKIEGFSYNWYGEHVDLPFQEKVLEIAEKLEMNPDDLMAIMAFESGFDPAIRNKYSNATGLIQFMPSTAKGLGTSIDDLAKMSAVQQLDYVYQYCKPFTGKIHNIYDAYMMVFMPIAVGKDNDFQLGIKDSTTCFKGTELSKGKVYEQNSGLDINKDGIITKAEAAQKVLNKRKNYEQVIEEPSKPNPYQVYKVQSGDTLSKIANQFNTTVQVLAKLNNITNINRIHVNQEIKLPIQNIEELPHSEIDNTQVPNTTFDENRDMTKNYYDDSLPEYTVEQDLLTVNKYSRPGTPIKDVKAIVVHYVGNPKSTAQANVNYFENLKTGKKNDKGDYIYASAHYCVGLDGEVIQAIPKDEVAYHAGARKTELAKNNFTNSANNYTIGIESCHLDKDGNYNNETYTSFVRLTADLLNEYDLDTDTALLRHNDISMKPCPRLFVESSKWVHSEENNAWEQFKKDVEIARARK